MAKPGGRNIIGAVKETLDSVVSPSVRDTILARALAAGHLTHVPTDANELGDFVAGPLHDSLVQSLGPELGVSVTNEIERVVALATPEVVEPRRAEPPHHTRTTSPKAVTIVAPVSHSSARCKSVSSIARLTGATTVAASIRSSRLPTQYAATQISGVVTGLVTKVVKAASGTLARTGALSSAANRICANGTMIPTISPSAIPRGTERRVKRHSSDRNTRCANGRMKRLPSICSRVGMLRFAQRETLCIIVGLI